LLPVNSLCFEQFDVPYSIINYQLNKPMKESFLHYVWQYKLFTPNNLLTTDGREVEIVNVGILNSDAGPDFFNAKIKIAGTVWAGNVEIHNSSSDWIKHNHQNNKSYDSVILHIVRKADIEIFRSDGEKIPQLELPIPKQIESQYEQLLADKRKIACEDKIATVPLLIVDNWKMALLSERLSQRTENIDTILNNNIQHWEEAFYIVLARNFGFGVNGQPFEMLAKSLSINILAKHKNNLFQIEALLFGQAGLLADLSGDDYQQKLKAEYDFLKTKYGLTPIDASQWKMLRLRPVNFPYIRIAQFATLIYNSTKLFSKILEKPEITYIQQLFEIVPSDYWHTHFVFGELSRKSRKQFGKNSINVVIINTVVPFLFVYGEKIGEQSFKDKAISLLESLAPESNSVISFWDSIGIKSRSAADTQALLQLYKNYCTERKCLHCRIGHKILTVKN
jgi:hypothetical protein